MNSPLLVGLTVFTVILGGAFTGWKLRKLLPADHLTEDTKSLVSVSTAIVATVSALVLGLLISNANSSFIRLGGEVTALSAQILRLDKVLLRYGRISIVSRYPGTMRSIATSTGLDRIPSELSTTLS